MIRHCVMLRLRPDHDAAELAAIADGLQAVCDRLGGASGFAAGPNRDFEERTADYPFGFTIDFESEAALSAYAGDPVHRELGARLKALCLDGADGIAVFDLEIAGSRNT